LFHTFVYPERELMTTDSKNRILNAAERLFAEKGYEGASLRSITSAARVNLASVNYHFRSMESLLQAVFERRLGPLNRRRLEMLDAFEAAAPGGVPRLEEILQALLVPILVIGKERREEGAAFQQLLGIMFAHPSEYVRRIFISQLREVSARFVAALRRALPELPPETLFWRVHFTIGAMAHTLAGAHFLHLLSGGRCDPSDAETATRNIIAFAAAGLRAPTAPLHDPRRAFGTRRGRASRTGGHRPAVRRTRGGSIS
jgi:AcrR family transcriptional regulator